MEWLLGGLLILALLARKKPAAQDHKLEARIAELENEQELIMKKLALLLTLLPTAALAQQTTIYGPNGNIVGQVTTDRQGSKTFYDAHGNIGARSSTDSAGTTTVYGPNGRPVGSFTQKDRR